HQIDNPASCRVAEKSGYAFVEVLPARHAADPDGIDRTASVMLVSRHDGRRRRFERTWDAP
ncbi:hypothetical protein ABZ544_30290, partial [Micromonospora sediminicola]